MSPILRGGSVDTSPTIKGVGDFSKSGDISNDDIKKFRIAIKEHKNYATDRAKKIYKELLISQS